MRARAPDVINVASTRFKADSGIKEALVHLRERRGAGGGGKKLRESQSWRRRFGSYFMRTMPGSFLQLPEQLRKMMGVIVVVYAAFGLTVSEAKTEICVYTRRG